MSYMHAFSSHSCYMPSPSHPPWLDHSNYVWRGVQVMELLTMQFSPKRERETIKLVTAQLCPTSSYFLSPRKPSIYQETLHFLPFHLYIIARRHEHVGLGAGLIANWPETGCVILIAILSSVPFSSHWASQVACSSQYKRRSLSNGSLAKYQSRLSSNVRDKMKRVQLQ
jgi:hypothetical protein